MSEAIVAFAMVAVISGACGEVIIGIPDRRIFAQACMFHRGFFP